MAVEKSIVRTEKSIKALALECLLKNAGESVRREQIESYVRKRRGTETAGEVTRRIRDLRRDGWMIETNAHSPDLRAGEYRLASTTRQPRKPPTSERALQSLLFEILQRPESDLQAIREVIDRRIVQRHARAPEGASNQSRIGVESD